MGKFVHRGFMHPGGVSPMKQDDGIIYVQDPGIAGTTDVKTQVEDKTKEIKKEESMTLAEKEQRRKIEESSLPPHVVPRKESKFNQFIDKVDDAWVDARDAVIGGVTDYYKRKPAYMLAETTIEASKQAVDAMGGSWDKTPTGDKVDIVLSTLGLSPGIGFFADAANTIQNLGQAGFNLVTGDFEEAKNDAVNAGFSVIGMIPFLGQGTTIGKITNKLSNLPSVKKINEGIEKTKNIVKKNNPNTKIDDLAINIDVEKMNYNIDRYGMPDPIIYPTPKNMKEFNEIIVNATQGTAQIGKSIASNLDEATKVIKQLDPKKSVKKLGETAGNPPRTIYEVTYPDGQKLRYWESSGSGGKSVKYSERNSHLNAETSEGHFGVLPGNVDGSNVGFSDSWYIKSDGWERGYGSEVIEETSIWLKSLNDNNLLPQI